MTSLNLSINYLRCLPTPLCHSLRYLSTLDLTSNELESLPNEISLLSNLAMLHLAHNSLTFLPASLNRLHFLQLLDVEYNRLTTLPSFAELPKLNQLRFKGNLIDQIIFPLGQAQGSLADHHFSAMPQFANLDLACNKLTQAPAYSLNRSLFERTKEIHLEGNQISSIAKFLRDNNVQKVIIFIYYSLYYLFIFVIFSENKEKGYGPIGG